MMGVGQSSLRATAFGVTFIFGSYSASSTMRPSARNASRSCGPARVTWTVEVLGDVTVAAGAAELHVRRR